jgi:hypothetical protein
VSTGDTPTEHQNYVFIGFDQTALQYSIRIATPTGDRLTGTTERTRNIDKEPCALIETVPFIHATARCHATATTLRLNTRTVILSSGMLKERQSPEANRRTTQSLRDAAYTIEYSVNTPHEYPTHSRWHGGMVE